MVHHVSQLPAQLAARHYHPQLLSEGRGKHWQHLSTGDLQQRVCHCAAVLRQAGLQRGEKVLLCAPSSPFWLIADLAIMMIGAISVPVFADASRETLITIGDECEIRAAIVDGPDCAAALDLALLPHLTLRWGRNLTPGSVLAALAWPGTIRSGQQSLVAPLQPRTTR